MRWRSRIVVTIVVSVAWLGVAGASHAGASSWWTPPLGQPALAVGAEPPPATDQCAGTWGPTTSSPAARVHRLPSSTTSTGSSTRGRRSTALHARGKHVVCYVEVGAAGNYYSAAQEGVVHDLLPAAPRRPACSGTKVPGYPEYYLNIRSPATVSIIESMIAKQCAAKGFDAVETDIDEEYTDASGFPLTKAVEESYMTTLANDMHGLGLAWWIKNPDDTGDSYATDMYPLADAVLTEQCNQFSTCGSSVRLRRAQGGLQRRVPRCPRRRSVPRTTPAASTGPSSTWGSPASASRAGERRPSQRCSPNARGAADRGRPPALRCRRRRRSRPRWHRPGPAPRSVGPEISAWNAAKAAERVSGFSSPSSTAMCTKLTPSSSRSVA